MLRGYVTADTHYYESTKALNPTDTEVPIRRQALPVPPYVTPFSHGPADPAKTQTPQEEKGMFGNVGWKDLITFIYFLGGIAALWINTSDRILILEQGANVLAKDLTSLSSSVKESGTDTDKKIRDLEKDLSTLRIDIIRAGVAK